MECHMTMFFPLPITGIGLLGRVVLYSRANMFGDGDKVGNSARFMDRRQAL
jgi:hypothetical protein